MAGGAEGDWGLLPAETGELFPDEADDGVDASGVVWPRRHPARVRKTMSNNGMRDFIRAIDGSITSIIACGEADRLTVGTRPAASPLAAELTAEETRLAASLREMFIRNTSCEGFFQAVK